MRPGFLIVFFTVLSICTAITQLLGSYIEEVREDSEALFWIYVGLVWAFVIIPPFLAVRAWNRWFRR